MAYLWSDGFSHYSTLPGSWSGTNPVAPLLTAAGYTLTGNTGSPSAFTLEEAYEEDHGCISVRTGTSGAGSSTLSRIVTSTANTLWFSFAFKGENGRQRILRLQDILDLDWDTSTGRLKIGSVQSTDVIILNNWWFCEVEIDKANYTAKVWINNTLQIETTIDAVVSTDYQVIFGSTAPYSAGITSKLYLTDFTVNDSSGTSNNTRNGPTAVITRRPTGNAAGGPNEWVIQGSATQNWQVAAQLNPNGNNKPYLQANLDDLRDQYVCSQVLPTEDDVFAVSVVAYARKGDLDYRALGLVVETTAGELEQVVELTETNKYYQAIFDKAPGDLAWNKNRVESSEFAIVARGE